MPRFAAIHRYAVALSCQLSLALAAHAAFVPDPTFGTAGTVEIALPAGYGQAEPKIVVLPDHAVLVGAGQGGDNIPNPQPLLSVSKLTPAGVPDASFGTGGTAVFSVGPGPVERTQVTDIAPLPDGRLLVLGLLFHSDATRNGPVLARLLPDGQPDPVFNGGATLRLPPAPPGGSRIRIALQGDGVLVFAVGNLDEPASDPDYIGDSSVTRIAANGAIDPAFATNGTLTEPADVSRAAGAIALPHGGFQILHSIAVPGLTRNFWRRYRADGSPDTAYGPGGERDILLNPRVWTRDFVALGDGRYGLATGAEIHSVVDAQGLVAVRFAPRVVYGNLVATGTVRDGRILYGAYYRSGFIPTPFEGFRIERINADGSEDTSIGPGGEFRPSSSAGMRQYGMAIDGPSRFVVASVVLSGGSYLVQRFEEARGEASVAIPAASPVALCLIALGLVAFAARRRVTR